MKKLPFLLFLVPAAVFADVVYLQGAGTITGKIVEQTAETVQVDVGGGIVGVPMSRVARIVRAKCPLDEYLARAAKLAPSDSGGWFKLAVWASQNGLPMNAHDAYVKVLVGDPNNAQARDALGYVQLNGKWLTEDESYQAQGFVKYHGEWMTPAQAQVEQTHSAQVDARREAEHRAQDAEIARQEAQQQADEAEKRAKEAEESAWNYNSNPGYWGGYGYGVTTWPSSGIPSTPRIIPPSQIPVWRPK